MDRSMGQISGGQVQGLLQTLADLSDVSTLMKKARQS